MSGGNETEMEVTGGACGGKPILTESELKDINYKPRHHQGKAVIISNKTFKAKDERKSSESDMNKMKELLKNLGFVGIKTRCENSGSKMVFNEVTKKKLKEIMEDAANIELNNYEEDGGYGCFLCVILSYADDGGIIYCKGEHDDDAIKMEDLQKPFQATASLLLKPKIFLVQGCPYTETTQNDGDGKEETVRNDIIPSNGDFLTQFCTQPGDLRWRRKKCCSEYIQAMDEIVRKFVLNGDTRFHLAQILTRVQSYMERNNSLCKIPTISSTLSKLFYFNKDAMEKR